MGRFDAHKCEIGDMADTHAEADGSFVACKIGPPKWRVWLKTDMLQQEFCAWDWW